MFFLVGRFKLAATVILGIILTAGILWSAWPRRQLAVTPTENQNTDTVRQQYADLYQAAWRQDEGQGSVLMTATLFVPPLIDLLGRDSQKSDMENQLYRVVQDTANNQVAIFLTVDSVAGPLTDQAIKDSLALTAEGKIFTLFEWKPLIAPSRIVNIEIPANSQSGVATFNSDSVIDWGAMTNLNLVSRGIGGVAERNFVWVQPGVLSAVE